VPNVSESRVRGELFQIVWSSPICGFTKSRAITYVKRISFAARAFQNQVCVECAFKGNAYCELESIILRENMDRVLRGFTIAFD